MHKWELKERERKDEREGPGELQEALAGVTGRYRDKALAGTCAQGWSVLAAFALWEWAEVIFGGKCCSG